MRDDQDAFLLSRYDNSRYVQGKVNEITVRHTALKYPWL